MREPKDETSHKEGDELDTVLAALNQRQRFGKGKSEPDHSADNYFRNFKRREDLTRDTRRLSQGLRRLPGQGRQQPGPYRANVPMARSPVFSRDVAHQQSDTQTLATNNHQKTPPGGSP